MRFLKKIIFLWLMFLMLPFFVFAADDDLASIMFRYGQEKTEYNPYALSKGVDFFQNFSNKEGLSVFIGYYDKLKITADTSNSGMDSVITAAAAFRVLDYINVNIKENSKRCEVLPGSQSQKNLEASNALLSKVKVYINGHSTYTNKAVSKTDISSRLEVLMIEAAGFDSATFEKELKSLVDICQTQSKKPDPVLPSTTAPATTYGSGNVTCGDRTFQCTKGGWFADVSTACYCCGSCTPDDLFVVANTFLRWLFGIIGAIGLAMFVWGGFKWITSAGDSGSFTEGKKAMTNVVIGLVIMFSAGSVVVLIQKQIGIKPEAQISVTGGSISGSKESTTQTPAATKDTVTYGSLTLGSSCNVRTDTKSSDCAEGMNCYGIKDNANLKGVCLPLNPKGSSKAGTDCWMLNKGEGDTCVIGTCLMEGSDTTPGTRGKCWTQDEIAQFMANTTCTGDAQCAKGLKCTNKKCIISSGSNVARGEACYVLPGSSTNDCASGLKCFTDLNNLSAPRKVGDSGKCAYNQSLVEWKDCLGNVECKTGYLCKSVPKLSDKNYCVSKSRTFNVEAGKSCVKFTVDGVVADNCVAPLECYYGKTTDKSGICVPANPVNSVGKNQECYLLPGASKMCTGDLKCVSYVSGSYKTTAGSKGLCFPPDGTVAENLQCFYLPGRNMCQKNLVCTLLGGLPKVFGNPGLCKKK